MQLSLPVEPPTEGVWTTSLSPIERDALGPPLRRDGDVSVLLVTEPPVYRDGILTFPWAALVPANRGATDVAVIIAVNPAGAARPAQAVGDARFRAMLPAHLAEIGNRLLDGVRARDLGDLTYAERSKRFVETPDNFWTVKIQPRDESLRVTVRGEPDRFSDLPQLRIVPDQAGYSAFKVSDPGQIDAAIAAIGRARRRG